MEKKIPQREYFKMLIDLATENERTDLVEFCKGRIEQLNKKSASKKPTKAQEENVNYAILVEEILSDNVPRTITEIMNSNDTLKALSNQKVTAIVKSMGSKVTKTIGEKGKSMFSLS